MTKCLSETNGFIFLNPGHSTVSLCSSGPQGFRQLTKHILLLLCCLPTMLFTYRRMGGSVQQMNETAWISLTEPIEKLNCSCWSCPKFKFLMIQVPVPRIFTCCDQHHYILRYREWHHKKVSLYQKHFAIYSTARCNYSLTQCNNCFWSEATPSPYHSQLAPFLSNCSIHLQFSGHTCNSMFHRAITSASETPWQKDYTLFLCLKTGAYQTTSHSHQSICIKVLFPFSDSKRLCQRKRKWRLGSDVLPDKPPILLSFVDCTTFCFSIHYLWLFQL